MAELLGLAASIIQVAGTGAKLSIALYNFTSSSFHADKNIQGIADDVELTSNALSSVGRVFEMEESKSIISTRAIQDANNIIAKCESVFNEISRIVEKGRRVGKDGKKSLNLMAKLSFPLKEQRIELNRRRLESLKNSLVLLLHVLQLAQGQVRGKIETTALAKERARIRELHRRQQESLQTLQALEKRFGDLNFEEDDTLPASTTSSQVPTLDLAVKSLPTEEFPPIAKTFSQATTSNETTKNLFAGDNSYAIDSDMTTTDDEEDGLSLEDLAECTKHVEELLRRITHLQHKSSYDTALARRKHLDKIYQRFRRNFELTLLRPLPLQAEIQRAHVDDETRRPQRLSSSLHRSSLSAYAKRRSNTTYTPHDTEEQISTAQRLSQSVLSSPSPESPAWNIMVHHHHPSMLLDDPNEEEVPRALRTQSDNEYIPFLGQTSLTTLENHGPAAHSDTPTTRPPPPNNTVNGTAPATILPSKTMKKKNVKSLCLSLRSSTAPPPSAIKTPPSPDTNSTPDSPHTHHSLKRKSKVNDFHPSWTSSDQPENFRRTVYSRIGQDRSPLWSEMHSMDEDSWYASGSGRLAGKSAEYDVEVGYAVDARERCGGREGVEGILGLWSVRRSGEEKEKEKEKDIVDVLLEQWTVTGGWI